MDANKLGELTEAEMAKWPVYKDLTGGLARPLGGVKHDGDKVRIELIPSEFIFAVASIMTFGAKKYEDRNWEKGFKWGRVFGALMRHLWEWWGGRGPTSKNFIFGELDHETQKSHLWHAACCIAFLITFEERGTGEDDRPTS